ncbi:tyrosine-type recombinase/integrase [Leucobacter sp. UT-8R-CII-1-4]|uniref:tyrosine-type recombinase/integrase n=1 Tax=Leucobacter sp. UT-8R-CII-1-4 TaxID=3040075 RepID=UPI0024A9A89A|nr:tyrosine-type recombinase/integrase [Leucobacter sp. UT-8R-CII-1-4]MDI6024054.1 tyrosine-type recombinase/integrase [Leucobacter sp. UT-8R-CII-1-4]
MENETEAEAFFENMRSPFDQKLDPLITLSVYAGLIGERFLRGVDMTSTASGYRAGLRLRVLPTLGHVRIRDLSAGIVDRCIDEWEVRYSPSTVKNTIVALTRVLDEAVRDEIISRNPARCRSSRRCQARGKLASIREMPSRADVERIAAACAEVHQSYSDHVMLSAFLAARTSEVAGLLVREVDWENGVVAIERQCFPGTGGLSVKAPKGRRARLVPIIDPVAPVLRRLTTQRRRNAPLLRGTRGGVITTAASRSATGWDGLAASLVLQGLRRHDLRHAGATWFANAGIPIHVVSDILGHASVETTRAYLHPDNSALRAAVRSMNQHFLRQRRRHCTN